MKDNYKVLRDKFHCYPLHKIVIGVEFAEQSDALIMKKLVERFSFSGDPKQVAKEEKKKKGIQHYKLTLPHIMERKQ